MSLKQFADTLPEYAKDLRLNLRSILTDQLIGEERKLGLLLACAHGSGYRPLVAAAEAEVEELSAPGGARLGQIKRSKRSTAIEFGERDFADYVAAELPALHVAYLAARGTSDEGG